MKIKNIFFALLPVFLFLNACRKTEVLEPTRLFRPVVSGSLGTVNNGVVATWTNIKAADKFQVQVSRDTFRTIDVTMSVDTNTVQVDNLKWDQLYQIQVRAIAVDTILNSRWSYLGEIKVPKFPSILNAQAISDATDEGIRVSWVNSGATVTNIRLLKPSDSSLVRDVALTSADVSKQSKIITGLTSSTTYIVMLYSGTTLRGYDNFTTKAPETGIVIDLRNISDRQSVLADTLPLIPGGATVLLKRGFTYNIASAVILSKAVTIKSGSDLSVSDPAIIYFTSNFNFVAGSSINHIDFIDLVLRGSDYASRYVFNTTASATVGRISFDNCKAEIFRGLVRLQSGTVTVANFNITNSIIDSIAGFGVLTVGAATAKVDNISINNSTFYKIEKLIASSTAGSVSSSVVIQNSTFNEATLGGGATYFIDYNTNNVAGGIQINNCILGAAKTGTTNQVRGVRYATSGTADGTGSYSTSDYIVTVNPISNLTVYPKPSTDLFTDPLNGNFKIRDNTFAGRTTAGDPRWR